MDDLLETIAQDEQRRAFLAQHAGLLTVFEQDAPSALPLLLRDAYAALFGETPISAVLSAYDELMY